MFKNLNLIIDYLETKNNSAMKIVFITNLLQYLNTCNLIEKDQSETF